MIRAVPESFFSWDFALYRGDARLGVIEDRLLGGRAVLRIGREIYAMGRDGWFGKTYRLGSSDGMIATARRRSVFRWRLEVCFGGRDAVLCRARSSARDVALVEGELQLGAIRFEGWLTRRTIIDLPDSVPVPVQAFLFWLVMLVWRRACRPVPRID